jgi:hypothetical protein
MTYCYDDGDHHETIWRVCVGAYGSTVFLVRAGSAEDAIECMVDCAIDNGLEVLFTNVEYPDNIDDLPEDDMWEAVAEAEADLYVVGHTTMPDGWGTAIPWWEIGLCEAGDDDCAAFSRWLAESEADDIEMQYYDSGAWRDE